MLLFEPEFNADWPLEDKRLVKPEELEWLANWLRTAPDLFIDYETNGTEPRKGHLPFLLGALSPDVGPRVVDFRLVGDAGRRAVADGLSKRVGTTIAHNIAFEARMSRAMGFTLGGTYMDPMHMAYAINELRQPHKDSGPFTQKALTWHELKREPIYAAAVRDWLMTNFGSMNRGWDKIPASLMFNYNIEDLECGWALYQKFHRQVIEMGMFELVTYDAVCADAVARAEERGIAFDVGRAKVLADEYSGLYKAEQTKVFDALGHSFDIHSPQKVFGLLYGQWELPMHSDMEKQGKVDDVVLKWMLTLPEVKADPRKATVIAGIDHLRELSKLKDTYLLPWLYEWQQDGIIYPHMNMLGARTRRFSANDPNLQNVPARTDLGAALRSCFMSRPGYTTYSMDESQAEYRVFADGSGDARLIKGYNEDPSFDIHQQIADMLGIPRKKGKNTNFGVLYGMGKDKMARSLEMSKAEAEAHLARYYALVPGLRDFRTRLSQQVKNLGYVRDKFGGRRHLTADEAFKALNSYCQMTVSNLIRRAMAKADPIVRRAGGNILLQVHDELLFELPGEPADHLPTLQELKVSAMEEASPMFKVPFVSDCEKWNPNWQHAEGVVL